MPRPLPGSRLASPTGEIRITNRFSPRSFTVDSRLVPAIDLDAPTPLPDGNMVLTISEAGPVGIFDTSVMSVQEIQTLLRNSQAVPGVTQVSMIADNATHTASLTIAEIQTLLGSTAEDFDIIAINAPPGSYDAAVDVVFVSRNGTVGTTQYNAAASGALFQSGDTLTGGEDFDAFYFYDYSINGNLPNPGAAAVRAGVNKIANGGTPMPQNRLYFQYYHYRRRFAAGRQPGAAICARFRLGDPRPRPVAGNAISLCIGDFAPWHRRPSRFQQ